MTFYVNTRTTEVQWTRPVGVPVKPAEHAAPLPPGWVERVHPESGMTLFLNTASGEQQWQRPTA